MEETGGERERPPPVCAEKGCFVKFVDLPRLPRPLTALPRRRYFFLRRTRKHDKRAIDPKTLYGENGSETRNTDGNLHL